MKKFEELEELINKLYVGSRRLSYEEIEIIVNELNEAVDLTSLEKDIVFLLACKTIKLMNIYAIANFKHDGNSSDAFVKYYNEKYKGIRHD